MRLVLAILLSVALFAAVSPVVEDARRDRAVGAIDGDVRGIESAARSLAESDEPTASDAAGARRVVTVRVPPASPTSAEVRYVAIGAAPGGSVVDTGGTDVIAVAVSGRSPRILRLAVDLRVAGRDDAALVLREAGAHTLVLAPIANTEAVAVRRASDSEAVARRSTASGPPVAAGSSRMPGPTPAMNPLAAFRTDDEACRCRATADGTRLLIDATDCPGGGDLAASPNCRRTAIDRLSTDEAAAVVVSSAGLDRVFDGVSGDLLAGAGEFVERVVPHDERLAESAREAPLAASRAGTVSKIARDTGMAALCERFEDAESALTPAVGLTMAGSLVDPAPPTGARLRGTASLPTGGSVRLYDRPDGTVGRYHLDPVGPSLSPEDRLTLEAARERLGDGGFGGGERAPGRAVRAVAEESEPVERLGAVLARHTRGLGVIGSLLSDDAVSDVFVSAPVGERPLRVVRDGRTYRTNVRLTDPGARTIASRIRRASGRPFSRASPTVDAAVETVAGDRVRVAGLTRPVSDGLAFAVRRGGEDAWTLPGLVDNGTLTPEAAALLSVAVRRDASILVAGPRGAGKTTTLGALLWELPAATRAVVIEDTPELPVSALGEAGRDVQRLHATEGGSGPDPAGALRTALRLGDGALVLGEVRGSEAATLFEAMRVGASDSAVLGTIHGEGGAEVRDRAVDDLGVAPAAFDATDAVVTLSRRDDGRRRRGLERIEEVLPQGGFASLFDRSGGSLSSVGRIDRGASRLLDGLAAPGESYAEVREALTDRAALLSRLARDGLTGPEAVTTAYAGGDATC